MRVYCKHRSRHRERYKANPERFRKATAAYRLRNPSKTLDLRLARHGLTGVDFFAMLEVQEGKCAICGSTKSGGRAHRLLVDHDHTTNQVRDLLCNPCNVMLGQSFDSPARLRAGAEYLEFHKSQASSPIEDCNQFTGQHISL